VEIVYAERKGRDGFQRLIVFQQSYASKASLETTQ
jgi:hypothetical protein